MTFTQYYTYVIQSLKDRSCYIGSCEDLDKRISKHNDGQSKYSSGKIPWRLRYFEVYTTRGEAIKREYQIKRMKSRKYIEGIIAQWMQTNNL